MSLFTFVRYLHFLGIMLFISALFAEALLLRPLMRRKEIAFLAKVDGLYGFSTILLLGAGLMMWFAVGKPEAFYTENPTFILKLVLFGIIGALSAWPTVLFIKHRKGNPEEELNLPSILKWLIWMEIVIAMLIPLLAVFMAQGISLI